MDDIYATRRKNLLRLLDSPPLSKLNRELDRAVALDVSPSMYSQLKSPAYKIGDPIARKIEDQVGLEYGWMDQTSAVCAGSQPARFEPSKVVTVFRALTLFLERRNPDVSIDLGNPEDAELFCQAYSEFAPLTGGPEAQMLLGATVTDLLAKRERRRDGRSGGSDEVVGAHGAQAGEAVAGAEATTDAGGRAASTKKGRTRRGN